MSSVAVSLRNETNLLHMVLSSNAFARWRDARNGFVLPIDQPIFVNFCLSHDINEGRNGHGLTLCAGISRKEISEVVLDLSVAAHQLHRRFKSRSRVWRGIVQGATMPISEWHCYRTDRR